MKSLTLRTLPLSVLFVLHICSRSTNARSFVSETLNSVQRQADDFRSEPETCQIYCHGPLLHTVQMARLFQDSKTFVDMKLKFNPEKTNKDFDEFMQAKNQTPTQDEIREFVNNHFDDIGKEFTTWTPKDWKEHPKFVDSIRDPDLRQWATDLNAIWKDLGRKMIDDVHTNPNFYSIIPVPNPVIVPGGRFIEFYYWDSYWIIRGLLYCEMHDTARGMLENFLSIVQRYGFIPNGGRVYYSGRSQPPLLAAMVKSYVEFTNDDKFALDNVQTLEHEFEYWMNNHIVQVNGYDVATYRDMSTGPRPESYREDYETARSFNTDDEREEHYAELKAAAESGMDFSSRWFINNEDGSTTGNLTNLKTRSVVPVDLNAILYWNAKIIAEFHMKANNKTKMLEYEEKAEKILEAINKVLWNESVGMWLDYDLINNRSRNYFVTSNLFPLWMKAYDIEKSEEISAAVLKYIEKMELDKFPGGVPNTLYSTGEQWDMPNVWPPMQYVLIEGLNNLKTEGARSLSENWMQRWVKSNFKAYQETRHMFEKYDAEKFGGHGGGGEYDVQTGFGWSNGVIVEYLARYGHNISLSTTGASTTTGPCNGLLMTSFMLIALITTLAGSFIG